MTAEKYLEQIKKIDVVIINKLKDHNRWVAIAEGIGGFSVGDRVQSSRNLHRGADAIGRYIDIEREIETLKQQRQEIIDTIQRLPIDEYKVLYSIFVDGCMLKELPSMFDKSYDWAKKTKRTALMHVQEIIDEKKG